MTDKVLGAFSRDRTMQPISALGRRVVTASFPVLAAVLWTIALIQIVRTDLGAWTTFATFLIGLALVIHLGIADRGQALILLLSVLVGISAVDYLAWRVEVINWSSWWLAVPLFVAETFGILHTLGFQYTIWPRAQPQLRATDDPTQKPIFILIPTVNEGTTILEPTLRGALKARRSYLVTYPHGQVSIVVCNDGYVAGAQNWRDVEVLAERMGVQCVTRTENGGAKAGNIENARHVVGATGDALIVIFDADQIAERDFLLKTIPPFADPTVGWVQTGQYYRNIDNPVARWANDQQALFYRVLCPGKSAQNAAFICGTNVVIRAAALDEIGGLPQDSITEDFAASIKLHPLWRSIFIPGVLATGLGPLTLRSYYNQQRRWAIGTLSTFRRHWREILLPGPDRLSIGQRIQYLLACTHYLSGMRDLIYIVTPLVFLLTGIPAVRGADLSSFFWHFLPYWLASQVAFWHAAWGKSSVRGIIAGFSSFPVLIGSLLTVLRGRQVGFTVTSKERGAEAAGAGGHVLAPHVLALAACILGLGAFVSFSRLREPALISAFWVVYTIALLLGALWLGVVDWLTARPTAHRIWSRAGQLLALPLRGALGVMPVVAVVALVTIFVAARTASAAVPASFVPRHETGVPFIGIALSSQLSDAHIEALEHRVGFSFSIVGRTQDIGDRFDRNWAARLAARGARPWITLNFRVPGAPAMNASLPAIANGLHDEALRRWARDLRDYAKPVYLTILQHVDRNWVLSSAVANGGIPQDVPRAWQHVRDVFRQEKALNVAWVWSPADPIHDSAYAPPLATIDVTLISLINYPDTHWVDPAKTLADLAAHYPKMPLFVEVSADGQPAQKADWLRKAGAAIAATPNVHAFLYHEGSPAPDARLADHLPWSLASDPLSLQAMRDAATTVSSPSRHR
jgi:cellulose synthase/poly-beta-1,6-N-acetylglucosamine synthase-like glycosyltransferase